MNSFLLKLKLILKFKIRSPWALKATLSEGVIIERYCVVDKFTHISKNSYIGIGSLISNSKIGPYCSIGPNVKIGLGEHLYSEISTSQSFKRVKLLNEKTILEGDNWIGTGAFIKQGVKIKFGSIVGANSVVLKDTEPFGIYGGVPAKLIKYRFGEKKQNQIKKSEWWKK